MLDPRHRENGICENRIAYLIGALIIIPLLIQVTLAVVGLDDAADLPVAGRMKTAVGREDEQLSRFLAPSDVLKYSYNHPIIINKYKQYNITNA